MIDALMARTGLTEASYRSDPGLVAGVCDPGLVVGVCDPGLVVLPAS